MLYIVSKKPHKHHYWRLFYHYHESVLIKLNENTLSYKTALHKKKELTIDLLLSNTTFQIGISNKVWQLKETEMCKLTYYQNKSRHYRWKYEICTIVQVGKVVINI